MKKVLAIVLSIAVIFSFATVAFAREIYTGQVWFGPKNRQLSANPGEEASFAVELKAKLNDEQKETYDKDGKLVIPFFVQPADVSMCPIQNVELTDAMKAAGAELTRDTNYENYGIFDENADEIYFIGVVTMPASYLFSTEAVDVLNVTVKINEEWTKDQYTGLSDNPLDITFNFGYADYFYDDYTIKIVSADESAVYLDNLFDSGNATVQVQGKAYEPTSKEKFTEWWRNFAFKLLTALNNFYNWLINDLFAPAPWNW